MFFSDKRAERLFFFFLAGPEFIRRVEMDKKGESEQHDCRRSSGAEQVQTGGLRTDRKHWVRGRRTRVDGAQMLRDKQEGADLVVVLVKAFTHHTYTTPKHTHTQVHAHCG